MFVPVTPHTTIINKKIIYSDTILPLKDTGNNIKIKSISNVSESSLENCIKIILESNPDVIFNTIQYSKNNKKVYFYTNKEISIKKYEESKIVNYKPITSRTEILEEVKKVLLLPKNKDNSCISLYDVLTLLKKLNNEYDSIEEKYKNKLDYMVESKIDDDSLVCFHGLDFKKKIIHISFKRYRSSDWADIYFAKQNGDLYVVKSESFYTDEVFSALCSTLSEMYDELLKYADYKDYKYTKDDIKPVNSNFSVKISHHGIWLFVEDFTNKYLKELELFAPSYNNGYKLECNSSIVNEVFTGKETEIFKSIFVKISDCPKWSQVMLYEIRNNQLLEEQKIEKQRQKKIELARKIFPFLKKY